MQWSVRSPRDNREYPTLQEEEIENVKVCGKIARVRSDTKTIGDFSRATPLFLQNSPAIKVENI
jgi:hypothetical protein